MSRRRLTREQFPKIAQEIGEDPARFLDAPLLAPDREGASPFLLAQARIRGIDRFDVLQAWITVEVALERGPREQMIALLNQRKSELDELGERSDRLGDRRWINPDSPESVAVWPENDNGNQSTTYTRPTRRNATTGTGGASR